MSTSSYDSVFGLGTTLLKIGVGSTIAQLITGVAGQNNLLLKVQSGGTLEIIGVPEGVTLTQAQLAAANQNHYILGASEILSLGGPVRLYLSATGATTIVMCMRGIASGN